MKKELITFVLLALSILVIAGCTKESITNDNSDELNIGVDIIDSESADLEITDLDVDETEFTELDI